MSLPAFLCRLACIQRPRSQAPVPPGLYHYMREADGAFTRLHLRVEPDGNGLLLANATAAAHLTVSGVIMAKSLLEDEDEDAILSDLAKRFTRVSRDVLQNDLAKVRYLLADLAAPDANYPILNLEDAAVSPHEARLIAPLRADMPLPDPENTTALVRRLWDIGIPHVCFLAAEDAAPADLVRAVERAEDTGLIAGVRALGRFLAQGPLLQDLATAGVDHVTVPCCSASPKTHDALYGEGDWACARDVIDKLHALEVCPVAEVPLVESNQHDVARTVVDLAALRPGAIWFVPFAAPDDDPDDARGGALPARALPQLAALIEESAQDAQIPCLWTPPVRRDPRVALADQVRLGPRCFGDFAVRVEPDGSVIPPRGPHRAAGNLLTDPWEMVWGHELFRVYRERLKAPTRCDVCPGLAVCAADCPRSPEGWASAVAEKT